jgi:diadenosine tetraphosphatase ApaH/serine/threonine PP2A family protein phosphatase
VRYAVLSDIHGNAEALQATLESLRERGIDHAVCLGDIVGYGADPSTVVESVRKWSEATVLGNHDGAAAGSVNADSFNEWARDAIVWTREQLSDDELSYLDGLPLEETFDGALLVHSSPRNPGSWSYVLDALSAEVAFESFEGPLCLMGHSHEPCFFETEAHDVRQLPPGELEMRDGARYIVNVGSVGQPRDGDPRASYGIVDAEEAAVEIVRVEYDAERAGAKIERAGLPVILAERLLRGA